jgi:hypothetical protein
MAPQWHICIRNEIGSLRASWTTILTDIETMRLLDEKQYCSPNSIGKVTANVRAQRFVDDELVRLQYSTDVEIMRHVFGRERVL